MSNWPLTALGEIFEIARGGSPRPIQNYITEDAEGVNWIMIRDASEGSKYIDSTKKRIRKEGVKSSRMVYPGDFLLTNSMSFGKPYIMRTSGCIHDGWLVLSSLKENVDSDYFYHLLRSNTVYLEFSRLAAGATVKNLNIDLVKRVNIPLPPLEEQKRIAEILDRAESLRAMRRQSIEQLNTLTQAIFLEMFGDPAINPKGWVIKSVGELASKFSDGPFGSNLKTSHYTETGIRVIRLQNIGVGTFVDKDKAYVSKEHFEKLKKHECRPGDVLIGTLGDPNLRACVQPKWLSIALNKADCVQLRANPEIAHPIYVCELLNQPSVERLAQEFIVGQTRLRISMGRVRLLKVPLPPLALQQEFAQRVEAIEKLKAIHQKSLTELDALFASLQHRAFRGEL